MQVNRGKVQNYLGMRLNYTKFGQVEITMLDYNNGILNAFNKSYSKGGSNKSIAEPDIIFKVNKYCENINSKKAVDFHHLVQKCCLLPRSTGWTYAPQFHSPQ